MPETSHLRGWLLAVGLLTLGGATAAAVEAPRVLYVRARNTRMMQSSAPNAKLVTVLQPGMEVRYVMPDPRDGHWHQVEYENEAHKVKKGVVFQANLSRTPPREELGGAQVHVSKEAQVYASRGAATKALGDGAVTYGQATVSSKEALNRLLGLEALARDVKEPELAEYARKTGLFQVVGPKEKAR